MGENARGVIEWSEMYGGRRGRAVHPRAHRSQAPKPAISCPLDCPPESLLPLPSPSILFLACSTVGWSSPAPAPKSYPPSRSSLAAQWVGAAPLRPQSPTPPLVPH